jgi:hypothetical protein
MLYNVIGEMRISHTVAYLMKREVLLGGLFNYVTPSPQTEQLRLGHLILFFFCISVCADIR